ncbi:MAG TPA: c-type cytochrome domain-containing protein, partial [Verrucomicrobiae bacterium]|nr:c-type cytochrome domain-containing protein [Verrucomicrobiae bacterium]
MKTERMARGWSQLKYLRVLPLVLGCSAFAGNVDTSKLPPPAQVQIDFTRDIKPILENSCFRCHGPEKPRSHFRLDNPDSALKGGDDGVDIIPGNSAKSHLIHYVAGLDEDMQMPPPGKGAPLTTNQIALLRAWIDQGVAWEATSPEPTSRASFTPTFGYTSVSGNERKFREHYWQKEGANGGLGEFDLWEKTGPDSGFSASGHLLRNDYKLVLENRKDDVGSIRYGWEDYRKYYDDTGGFDPLISPTAPTLNRDLQLDLGRAWIDFTLALPDWPLLTLGYEYQYKRGNEANLEWGNAVPNARAINPASNFIRENTHIVKFGLDHEIAGTRVVDEFRGEFYSLSTSRINIFYDDLFSTSTAYNQSEGYHHFQAANTVRLER